MGESPLGRIYEEIINRFPSFKMYQLVSSYHERKFLAKSEVAEGATSGATRKLFGVHYTIVTGHSHTCLLLRPSNFKSNTQKRDVFQKMDKTQFFLSHLKFWTFSFAAFFSIPLWSFAITFLVTSGFNIFWRRRLRCSCLISSCSLAILWSRLLRTVLSRRRVDSVVLQLHHKHNKMHHNYLFSFQMKDISGAPKGHSFGMLANIRNATKQADLPYLTGEIQYWEAGR